MIEKRGSDAHQNYLAEIRKLEPCFTDTHAHVHFKGMADNIENILNNCKEHRVKRFCTVGIELEDSRKALEMAKKYENIYAVLGVHPHDSADFKYETLSEFEKMLSHEKAIAVGEIGLDFYRNHSPKETQEQVFNTFLDLAITKELPVVIHNRDATENTIAILNNMVKSRDRNGIIHCFNGDMNMLKWALDNNFYLSFAGPVTYKKSDELRESLKYVPLDRLFIETDCPYLSPMPYRGKENEPAYVIYTAKTVAEIKGVSLKELADQLEINFKTLFTGIND